ncbi:MAG: MFS transporter, partial [Chloroflexi bacterium]|nr:MFS transporter [Chloroflexota bacterium]
MFWAGSALSISGRQTSMLAMAWLLFDITGSPLQLGLLGFARFVPALVLGLAGGVAADKADRRQLLIGTGLGGAMIFAALA